MVAERNTKLPKHPELETIPNLQVSIISKLLEIYDPGCSSRIRILIFYPFRMQE
jgi:hypothetical protein